MPSAPSSICKPASFPRGLDFAARAPEAALAHLTRITRCQTRANPSHDAGSAQEPARWPPAPRSRRCSPPAAATVSSPTSPSGVASMLPRPGRPVHGLRRAGHRRRIRAGRRRRCRARRVHRRRVPAGADERERVHGDRRGLHARRVHHHRRGRRHLRLSVPRVALQPQRSGAWPALPRRHCVSTPPPSRTAS